MPRTTSGSPERALTTPIDRSGEPRRRLLRGRGEGGSLQVGVYSGRLGGVEHSLG
jgi:hypothetical protein